MMKKKFIYKLIFKSNSEISNNEFFLIIVN